MAQRYIPGLNQRPENDALPESSAPKEVPQELIDDFKNGLKQVNTQTHYIYRLTTLIVFGTRHICLYKVKF